MITRRKFLTGACLSVAAPSFGSLSLGQASAAGETIKIGVLTDMSGLFSDSSGPGSVACVTQAVEEFANRGIRIDVLTGDHQNKPDVAVNIARQWYDNDKVDVIVDVPNSSVALAISQLSREKNGLFLASGAATSRLTGDGISPNTIHWTYNTAMLGASAATALVHRGSKAWYFITTNATSGTDLERDATFFIRRAGGNVAGAFRVPANQSVDFRASFAEAQSRKVDVVALATIGDDSYTAIRQSAEAKPPNIKTVVLQMLISDVHSLGLAACQGIILTEAFYWDLNDRTRAFAARVRSKMHDRRPGMIQAGCYSAVFHYLKAVADIGVRQAQSGRDVVKRMKQMTTDDDAFGPGRIRDDGRKIHPAYLFEVKAPSQSRGPWDYYNLLQPTSADDAFGYNPNTECPECKSGCRCKNQCGCEQSCCPN